MTMVHQADTHFTASSRRNLRLLIQLWGYHYDNLTLQLVHGIKSHNLCCCTHILPLSVSLVGEMSASKLIHYFPSHPAAFMFWASSPLDNITLNPANKKIDQSIWFSNLYCCGCSCHRQLISHTWTVLVDTVNSLQGSDVEVIRFDKFMNYVPIFTSLWTMLCLYGLISWLIF